MKAYVITIEHLKQSVECADRCIASGAKYGLHIEKHKATTPRDNPNEIFNKLAITTRHFSTDIGSRPENVLSAFLSHYSLWLKCIALNETIAIFEHDAVILNNIPVNITFKGCMNIGAPSYGAFKQPMSLGKIDLTSKNYFPGAHAYMLNPSGAKRLVDHASVYARPTDIYLQNTIFPWLEEYYPWPVIAKDTFSTIQNQTGSTAKHNYGLHYEYLKV